MNCRHRETNNVFSPDECEVLSKNIIELQEEITELENQIAESKGLCAAECKELGSKFEYFGKACDYLKLQNSNAILLFLCKLYNTLV